MKMIKEALVSKIVEMALELGLGVLKDTRSKLLSTSKDVEGAINHHIRSVRTWASEISFNDLRKAKSVMKTYVPLDFYVYPKRIRVSQEEEIDKVKLFDLFELTEEHIIVLGHPGAGKTTSMKYICNAMLGDNKLLKNYNFPLLVKFRDMNALGVDVENENKNLISGLFEHLRGVLGINIAFDVSKSANIKEGNKQLSVSKDDKVSLSISDRYLIEILNELRVLLILDGFDELYSREKQAIVLREIRHLASTLDNSKIIMTSRTGDFIYNIEKAQQFEICALSYDQIYQFSTNWLQSNRQAKAFIGEIDGSPFSDAVLRPLTLAHLCAIYERSGKVPDKPKTVYRKIINLLLEEWDQQRSVKRISKYAHFEIDRKFEFLSALAYKLTVWKQKTIFSKEELIEVYLGIYMNFDLLKKEVNHVVSELETHTGLFVQTGYEMYEFAHKSMQEYLCAEYIVKLPSIPEFNHIIRIPNELAIAVSISSNPSEYFSELILGRLSNEGKWENFVLPFMQRLVSEKPDFVMHGKIGFALLVLYSYYLKYKVIDGSDIYIDYDDDASVFYDKLLNTIFKNNRIDKSQFYHHYKATYSYTMLNGDHVVHLRKNDVLSKGKIIDHYRKLPDEILVRNSLLNLFV